MAAKHRGALLADLGGYGIDNFRKHQRWQDRIGDNSPNHRLTERKVVSIRERYACGGITLKALGVEFGVSTSYINDVVAGNTWIYAGGPVRHRQLLRARCTTKEASVNRYGERTMVEEHPRPELLTEAEADILAACEASRQDDRYVSREERRAFKAGVPIRYEWGVYDPQSDDAVDPDVERSMD